MELIYKIVRQGDINAAAAENFASASADANSWLIGEHPHLQDRDYLAVKEVGKGSQLLGK